MLGALVGASPAACGSGHTDGGPGASASPPAPTPVRAAGPSAAPPPAASAAPAPSGEPPGAGAVFEPRGAIATWVGRWSAEGPGGDVAGTETTASSVLEVVAVSEERAIARINVESGNGHQCHAAGGARLEGDALVLRGEAGTDLGEGCILRIERDARMVRFEDVDDRCRPALCGTRAAFAHARLPRSARRPLPPEVRADLLQLGAARPR